MIEELYYLRNENERLVESYKLLKVDVANMLTHLGLDINDPAIKDTPMRVAKMLVVETCGGLFKDPPKMTLFPNTNKYNEIVLEKNIKVHSMCEHHLLPFTGVAHVAYLPGEKVLGISKFNRVVDYFARRPQLQERLTNDVGTFLQKQLEIEDVAVILSCTHLCTVVRGVKDENSRTVTSFLGGKFFKPEVRAELLTLIGM